MTNYAKQADTAVKVASILGSVDSHEQFKVARNIMARFIKTQPDKSLMNMVRDAYRDSLLSMNTPRADHEVKLLEL